MIKSTSCFTLKKNFCQYYLFYLLLYLLLKVYYLFILLCIFMFHYIYCHILIYLLSYFLQKKCYKITMSFKYHYWSWCVIIAAAVIAQKMGLPIRIVSSVNKNDAFAHAIETGELSTEKSTKPSIAPAMDIMVWWFYFGDTFW